MVSNGHKVSTSGIALVILCFFLPWVLVSCGGMQFRLTGSDLAFGREMSGTVSEHNALLLVVPVGAVLALVLMLASWQRNALHRGLDGILTLLCGLVPIPVMLLTLNSLMKPSVEMQGINMGDLGGLYTYSMEIGFWGTILGLLLISAGGVMNLFDSSFVKSAAPPVPMPPPIEPDTGTFYQQ